MAVASSDHKAREPDYIPPSSVTADTILAHPQARQPTLHLGSGWAAIPPLRTPSPRASAGNSSEHASSTGGFFNVVDGEPTEAPDAPKHMQPDHELEPVSLQRQPTTSTVVSSLGKDNDLLSDEILRSLSPGGSSSADPSTGDGHKNFLALNPNAVRDSSYTLQDYDSYWADTSDKAPTAPPFATIPETKQKVDQSPATPGPDGNACVDDVDTRKRFSWEADEGMTNVQSPDPAHQMSKTHELADAPVARSELRSTPPPDSTNGDALLGADAEPPKPVDSTSWTVARSDEGREPPEVPQPPSPLPASSGGYDSAGQDHEKVSRSDEGAQAPDTSSVFSPTPPPESHTSPTDQPPSQAAEPQDQPTHTPSMTFREIMTLSVPEERITKYNETRNYFASADTGLNAWLESLQAQNPEYASGFEYLSTTTSHPLAQAESHSSATGAQPQSAQQPYYQQYLNAAAPSTSSIHRSRPGGSSMPSQSTGSAFGHPSHQIGFKSKEFMHTAGKMGKGLLSKGKNKLRGSGDKGESHTSLRNERRSSWAFSLGSKSRLGDAGSRATPAPSSNSSNKVSSSVDTRRHGQPSRLEPLAKSRSHDLGNLGRLQPLRHPKHLDSTDRVATGLGKLQISEYLDNGATQLEEAKHASQLQRRRSGLGRDHDLNKWAALSGQVNHEQQVISPEPNLPSITHAPPTASTLCDDGGGVQQPHLQARSDVPRRDSSSAGLPLIRRGSTFGITTRAKRASRRFSLDDDDTRDHGGHDFSIAVDGSLRTMGLEEPPSHVSSPAPPAGSSMEPAFGNDGALGVPIPLLERTQDRKSPGFITQSNYEATKVPALASFDAALPILPRLSPMLASPIPGLATGPWKLEESHLSEPLQQVTRHRPGTGSSQQPMFYGYDKETGLSDPLRPFDVPPSSAQRWPGLFSPLTHDSPQLHGRSPTRVESEPQLCTATPLRGEVTAGRSRHSEPEVNATGTSQGNEGRNQLGLGISKHPAIPITRTSSRSRPAWMREGQPASADPSIAAGDIKEATKKQRSFLSGGTGSAPANHDSSQTHTAGAHDKPKNEDGPPRMPWQWQLSHQSSMAGVRSGGEITPSSARRLSSSSLMNDSNRVHASDVEAKKKKNRLSGMVNLANFKDLIHGSGTDQREDSQAPRAANIRVNEQHQHEADLVAPAPAPFRRSSTMTSFNALSPQPVVQGKSDKSAKRSSVSGMLLDFLGHKPVSKSEGRRAPRHANSSSDLQARRQQEPVGMQSHVGTSSPGTNLNGPPRPFSPSRVTQHSQAQATSDDATISPPHFTAEISPYLPGNQLCSSPLAAGHPISLGGRTLGVDCRLQAQRSEVVPSLHGDPGHRQNPSAYSLQPHHDGTGPRKDCGASLAGIGAQHVTTCEDALLRSWTVSPVLSVTSEGKVVEQQNSAGQPRVSGAGTSAAELHSQIVQTTGNCSRGNSLQEHGSFVSAPQESLHRESRSAPPFLEPSHPPSRNQKQQHGPRTSNQREDLGDRGNGAGFSGKDMKTSERASQTVSQSHGKSKKGDRKARSKLWGAFRRFSRSLESTRGTARKEGTEQGPPQRQLPHHQPTSGQKALHTVWTTTPAQSEQSSLSGVWTSPGALSPEPSEPPANSRRHVQTPPGQRESVHEGVPIPREYQEAHMEGLVSPTAYSIGSRKASGRHAQPHQQPHGGHVGLASPRLQLSPPLSQESPLRHSSVSSLGIGPSPLLGLVDSRATAGLGVIVPRQASMSSLGTFQESRPGGPEATEKSQDCAAARLERYGKGVSGVQTNVDDTSADAAALSQRSRSPILYQDPMSLTEREDPAVTADRQVEHQGTKQHRDGDMGGTGSRERRDSRTNCESCAQSPRIQSGDGVGENGVPSIAVDVASAAELDDTTDRYQRSRRLESQEEKILFRAEDAEDYMPLMSATSWPGQEWNPYGEPGFGDWKED